MTSAPHNRRVLTGITTTGTPHLGNYVGAIRPAVAASREAGVESFYFLADYHALIKCDDPVRIQRSTLEIAATWLAAGLDPERVTFYRQSDIPEIPELTWLLTCVTGKGILNRAHAYKASVDRNNEAGNDPDADVTAGLFMYPVLMAADILMFKAHEVPVGRDQIQHIEMARDIAQRFNHLYGEHFVLPEAVIEESVATLPGLDGRKMSKSYDNTLPLFAKPEAMRKLMAGILTDSRAPGEPKRTEGSALFQIYQGFATPAEADALRQAFADGIAWGDAKTQLWARVERDVAPLREHYEALMAQPQRLEDILQAGASKARSVATPFMRELRQAVGLRSLVKGGVDPLNKGTKVPKPHGGNGAEGAEGRDGPSASSEAAVPVFKQYREADGQFYFKLNEASGRLLLQSHAYSDPKAAGKAIAELKAKPDSAWATVSQQADLADGVSTEDVLGALRLFSL
jgi:tryptophanyl-tRNA synthetase